MTDSMDDRRFINKNRQFKIYYFENGKMKNLCVSFSFDPDLKIKIAFNDISFNDLTDLIWQHRNNLYQIKKCLLSLSERF